MRAMPDDDLKPRQSRSGRAIGGKTPDGGVIVKVTTNGARPSSPEPTRYARHLRRQAANRIRVERGEKPLPAVRPGDCGACGGWGVLSGNRVRCTLCGGGG